MGRTDEFGDSATTVRAATPQRPRPITPIAFKPTSVLQPYASSGTGYAAADRERMLMGQHLSTNGQSQSSAQATTIRKYPFLQIGA